MVRTWLQGWILLNNLCAIVGAVFAAQLARIAVLERQGGSLIPIALARYPRVQPLVWWAFGLVFAWYASTYPHGVWAS